MTQTGGPGPNNPFRLPNIETPIVAEGGSIWTNMSAGEIVMCLGGEDCKVPHSGYCRVCARKTAPQEITPETWTDITFDAEDYNCGNLHSNVTNPERITIGKNGDYRFAFALKHDNEDNVIYKAKIVKNGSAEVPGTLMERPGDSVADVSFIHILTPQLVPCETGDYFTVQFWHNETSDQTVFSDNAVFAAARRY